MSKESDELKRLIIFLLQSLTLLELPKNEGIILDSNCVADPVDQILFKFFRHPSIKKFALLKRTLIISHFRKFQLKILGTKLVNQTPLTLVLSRIFL